MFRVLMPNMRASMVAPSVLTATMVLGEFTFASLLLKDTLPTYMVNYQQRRAAGRLALALSSWSSRPSLLGLVVALRCAGAASTSRPPVCRSDARGHRRL